MRSQDCARSPCRLAESSKLVGRTLSLPRVYPHATARCRGCSVLPLTLDPLPKRCVTPVPRIRDRPCALPAPLAEDRRAACLTDSSPMSWPELPPEQLPLSLTTHSGLPQPRSSIDTELSFTKF